MRFVHDSIRRFQKQMAFLMPNLPEKIGKDEAEKDYHEKLLPAVKVNDLVVIAKRC